MVKGIITRSLAADKTMKTTVLWKMRSARGISLTVT